MNDNSGANLINKSAGDAGTTTNAKRQVRKHRPNQWVSVSVSFVIAAIASTAGFIIGSHLRKWYHSAPGVTAVDAARVTILPSSTAAAMLFDTPDGRGILVTSDLGPATVVPLVALLKQQHRGALAGIVVTGVTPNTATGIVQVTAAGDLKGPVVSPYDASDTSSWWARARHNFNAELKRHSIAYVSWDTSEAALNNLLPETTMALSAPQRTRWDPPTLAARIAFGDSSVLDLTTLSARQVAAITDAAGFQKCQVLLVNGQDEFVSKELLSDLEPDVVVLTGPQDIPPGDRALHDVEAADARAVALATNGLVALSLPREDSAESNTLR